MALIRLIESLLTLNLVDELTETTGKPNKESVAQGIANTVTGFFGGMGGCAMVGQSIINIKSGGRDRLSGFVAGAFLLSFILLFSQYIEQIPIAVLVGVLMSAIVFAWQHAKQIYVTKQMNEISSIKTYQVNGALFFANTHNFQTLFS